jgi:hypothetical protein
MANSYHGEGSRIETRRIIVSQPLLSPSVVTRALACVALLASAQGCAGIRAEPRAPLALSREITSHGRSIYFGDVYPLTLSPNASQAPMFVYERRVEEREGSLLSTHLTRDPSTGGIVLAESAVHSTSYALSEYTLLGNQLGQSGSIRVEGEKVIFRWTDGAAERTHVETQRGTVVVGPTLVGYIVQHLAELRENRSFVVRFAVLDRLETIGFELSSVAAGPGQTRVKMKPSSFVIGLIVDPLYFTFDTATDKLIRLEGRVPPRERRADRLYDFDARVEYRFVAEAYR